MNFCSQISVTAGGLGDQQCTQAGELRCQSGKFRILPRQNAVARFEIDRTFQVLTGAIAVARNSTAKSEGIQDMVGVGLEVEGAAEVMLGGFQLARVNPKFLFGAGALHELADLAANRA